MKRLSMILLVTGLSALASSDVLDEEMKGITVNCRYQANYIPINTVITLTFGDEHDYLGSQRSDDGKSATFSWSQSQCEDETKLTVELKELRAFLDNKSESFSARLEHAEVEDLFDLQIECTR